MSGNRLLDRLGDRARGAVMERAQRVERPRGSTVYEQGERMATVHFPLSGVYSVILRMEEGGEVEALTVGNEGMLGTAAFLHGSRSPFDTVAQIGGSTLTLPTRALREVARQHADLDELLRRYTVFEQRHVHQSAACNALHHAEQRLARWLLMSHDRANGDRLPLTQEFLAAMLGVRRQAVGHVAHELQDRGLIRYSRGLVEIVDRDGLEREACECYAAVRGFYGEIFDSRDGAGA